MKNKRKEKSFTQGPIMLGITIGLGIFVCTAAAMIGLSYFGVIGNEAVADTRFTPGNTLTKHPPSDKIEYKRTLEDSIGIEDKIDLP